MNRRHIVGDFDRDQDQNDRRNMPTLDMPLPPLNYFDAGWLTVSSSHLIV